jgi:2,4-dienoyl-CoA reductase-like NADH-dependent reductase (Old Yellow Enzyme family)/thioredoxin reductase
MKLFEPITIRGMVLKNRVIMPAMQINLGFRSERARAFYTERARGGCAAIVMPATSIDQFISDEVWGKPGRAAQFVDGCRSLTKDVHQVGAKVGVQLWHAKYLPSGIGMYDTRGQSVAPSATADRRELTTKEVEGIVAKFAAAAAAAKQAGFDFVEFHGAHRYLPCEFFSPLDNRRTDKYGGSRERRMTFGIESIKAMRAAVGDDYPIFVRLGARGDRPGDTTPEDAAAYAVELERAGADMFDVSVALTTERGSTATPGADLPMGTYANLAEAVKRRVRVPVAAVGRINKPEVAEDILAQGKADLIALGRQLFADAYWPEKIRSGRASEVRPCLSCNICMDLALSEKEMRCSVNPAFTRELECAIKPAERKKKVLVVGGGPGGMEAATIAVLRGHKVTLCEKEGRLGGQLLLAAVPPYKEPIGELNQQMVGQLRKAGVEVKLNYEATPELIARAKPDAVVVATGSVPTLPQIPGVKDKKVADALDVLSGRDKVGSRVVVIGGELVGCEVADYLADKGKTVTITRRGPEMALKVSQRERDSLLERLTRRGVIMLPMVQYEEITAKGLVIIDKEGKKRTLEADTIVLAAGAAPRAEFAENMKGKVPEVHLVGDCLEPRRILEAIEDGAKVGRQL